MRKLTLITILTYLVQVSFTFDVYAQNIPMTCICFSDQTPFINIRINKDSTLTEFQIINEGYETEESRKKVFDEYDKNPWVFAFAPEDLFYQTYYSYGEKTSSQVTSLENEKACIEFVTVEEIRSKSFINAKEASDSIFIFFKKIADNEYLRWEALWHAIE